MMSGGTALMLALRQRMVTPAHIVSIRDLRALRGIAVDPHFGLRIGAASVHTEVARSAAVREGWPMLADMASRLANPQVRNQGTIGGNLCYADPATDPPSCLMALDAQVVLSSSRGDRLMSIEEFVVDYYTTALEADELVSEIRVPHSVFNTGYHARFLRTAAEHRPMVNLSMAAKREGDVCLDARLVVGASVVTPTRIRAAEAALQGKVVTPKLAAEAAEIVASEIEPISDIRGSDIYRRDMVRVLARRTIERLFDTAVSIEKGVA
jgi:carbon-monoxide dehydrogenase medium subunit